MLLQKIGFVGMLWFFTASFTPNHYMNQVELQQQKKQECKRVSKKEFKEKLATLDDVQLIDVRTPGEFKNGTIKGAKNIDFFAPNFEQRINALDKDKAVLIFCQSGGRSAKALAKLKSMGFSYVLELEGGYSNWVR